MATVIPPLPILQDIAGMSLLQLQAYCTVYELPVVGVKIGDLRDNLRRVRLIAQGDIALLTDSDRRELFNAWGLEGDWSTAPSDNIAVTLVGFAHSLVLRHNALAYCRTPLTMTNKNPRTVFTGTAECDITVKLEAADDAGLPLTGTAECDIALTVICAK
jgi:hypothetical protein